MTCPRFSPASHTLQKSLKLSNKSRQTMWTRERKAAKQSQNYSGTNKFSQTYVTSEHMLGLVTPPGPMRVTRSAVVRVCVRHPCVTVPKRVTEAWEQNSSCQHAMTRGRECAQSPHTPAYRDLWRAGAGEKCMRSSVTTNFTLLLCLSELASISFHLYGPSVNKRRP